MTGTLRLDLTARTVAVALLAVVVVAAGVGWFAVVAPKRSQASRLETTIAAKQAQLANATHAQTADESPKGVKVRNLGKALPDRLAMPQVVEQLNQLATRAGVTLDTVTPSAAVPGFGYEAVPLSIVVDGHFFAVEQFLHLVRVQVQLGKDHVRAAGRLFDVQSVSLQQTEPAPMVTATLNLRAFYYASGITPLATATDTTASPDTTSAG
jgi:Tfp pilus assembly protein PilO